MYLMRGLEVKTFPGAMVELVLEGADLFTRQGTDRLSAWQVLSKQSVRVFVRSALPGRVSLREVNGSL